MTPRPCTDNFLRLNNGRPACGRNYCPYVWDPDVDCEIKPSRDEPRVLRRHET